MSKEGLYVLRGKLTRKPWSGFSYGKTRKAITDLLLGFKVDEKDRLFNSVGNLKVEEDKFDVPVRLNKRINFGMNNDVTKEAKICEFIVKLEQHFGIGTDDEGTEKRVREMEDQGIIPVSHFTEFEESDYQT